jgi:hypothetical protein
MTPPRTPTFLPAALPAGVATALAANAADFARRWGPIDWRDTVANTVITPDPAIARMLWALSNIENEAFYVRISLQHGGMDRLAPIEEFLAIWLAEESEHARALAELSHRYGRAPQRLRTTGSARRRPFSTAALRATGRYRRGTLGAYLVVGAIQEHVAITTYRALADLVPEPPVRDVLAQIVRQEGRHMRFYLKSATTVLDRAPAAQRYTRAVLRRFWQPPGVALLGVTRWVAVFAPLLVQPQVPARLCRIEDIVAQVPGLGGLSLMQDFLAALPAHNSPKEMPGVDAMV